MESAVQDVPRVLIIDDDKELCALVTEYLRYDGMEADFVHNGETGTAKALSGDYAVIVLDVMLPGIGGFEVLRRLRAAPTPTSRVPVMMLTARGDEVDRVLGFEIGADDYLPKPFSSRELVARLRAILRRARPEPIGLETNTARSVRRVGDVELNTATRQLRRGGELIEITSTEFAVLDLLLSMAGEVTTREVIAQRALERPLMPHDRTIDTHVSNLRRKLGPDIQGNERIKTVRGVGYIYATSEGAK